MGRCILRSYPLRLVCGLERMIRKMLMYRADGVLDQILWSWARYQRQVRPWLLPDHRRDQVFRWLNTWSNSGCSDVRDTMVHVHSDHKKFDAKGRFVVGVLLRSVICAIAVIKIVTVIISVVSVVDEIVVLRAAEWFFFVLTIIGVNCWLWGRDFVEFWRFILKIYVAEKCWSESVVVNFGEVVANEGQKPSWKWRRLKRGWVICMYRCEKLDELEVWDGR